MQESKSQTLIITHAILIGATPLIPIPVVDDLAKTYLQRRMVRELVEVRGQPTDPQSVKALADDRGEGCLWGCIGGVVLYPLKKIFRKIFFVLEWKRAIDLVSRSYHHGYLMDYALSQGWIAPAGPIGAPQLRAAMDEVCRRTPIKPVEHAVRVTFDQSKAVVRDAARLMQQSFQRLTGKSRPNRNDQIDRITPASDLEEVARAIEAVEPEEERKIRGLVSRLQQAIEGIPKEHFRKLEAELATQLGVQPPT